MKARVTLHLNIRTGAPKILPNNNPGFYNPGETVNIVDSVIGDVYKGNNIWYRLEEGGYVWSGAVSNEFQQAIFDWWHTRYNMEYVYQNLNTWGDASRVAIIDSGIDMASPYLDSRRITGINMVNTAVKEFPDSDGHGTAVTGILSGDRMNFFGAAPMCNVYMIKSTEAGVMSEEELFRGLESVPAGIDIVTISQALSHTEALKGKLLKFITARPNTVFVCGAGNDGIEGVVNNLPASLSKECNNVISVAASDKEGKASAFFSCRSDTLTLSAPGEEIRYPNKWDPSKVYTGSGTSFATPIVAGLIALAKAHLVQRKKFRGVQEIVNILKETLFKNDSMESQLYGLGIIDPKKFSDRIKVLHKS